MIQFADPPDSLILHCSAGPDRKLEDWPSVISYHVNDRGWDDVGYHYGIEWIDNEIVLHAGRPVWAVGAHCRANGMNHRAIGICIIGEFDVEPPRRTEWWAVADALAWLSLVHRIAPERVFGHSEHEAGKTCPGLMWDMDEMRAAVDGALSDGHRPNLVLGWTVI